jgi:hypothetical protein
MNYDFRDRVAAGEPEPEFDADKIRNLATGARNQSDDIKEAMRGSGRDFLKAERLTRKLEVTLAKLNKYSKEQIEKACKGYLW